MSVTKTYNFEDGTGLVFDTDLIEVLDGIRLKLQDNPGQDFTEDFADDTGFTYDSDLAEFVAGQLQQKNKRLADAILYASFNMDEDANWTDIGTGVGTLSDGATVSGGKLDLTGYVANRRLSIEAYNTSHNSQKGCMRCKFTPNYSGPPSQIQYIMQWRNGGLENNIQVLQNTSRFMQAWIRDGVGGNILATASFGVFNFVAGQTYEIEFNWDCDLGEHRMFIDGVQQGTTQSGTGTRDNRVDQFDFGVYYNNLGQPDFYIDEFIYFNAVQHTANYTPDWSDIYEYDYVANNVILPEMEYTGAGALVTFDSFTTTEGGSPRFSLQIGRSGNYLYWNGSAWVTSDGTYSQANDKTTFNANLASLDIEGEIYGQFKIHFDNSATQSSVDELTASLTAQIYPLTNPSAYISDATSLEELLDLLLTITKTGSDEVKIILYKGNIAYYHNGADWVVSDETYSQSNTLTEIQTNKATFTTIQINMYVRIFLHSETGLTSPEAGPLQIVYDFAGVIDTIHKTIVYGYQLDADGNVDTTDIVAYLNLDLVEYKNVTQITGDNISATPRSDEYWEMELVDTDNMEGTPYYFFRLKDKIFKKYVTEVDYISFNSLTDV